MAKNDFEKEEKYRLFRSVQEILHPSISKKNISDYEIIIDENILPVRVFYPKKISNLSKVIIFIHGSGKVTDCHQKYSDICRTFTKTNCLVIAIEYQEEKGKGEKLYQKVYSTVQYLYSRLEKNAILPQDIILVGDSTGGHIITGINYQNKGEINIQKEILFYPALSLKYNDSSFYNSFASNKDFNMNLLKNLENYFSYLYNKKERENLLFKPLESSLKTIPKTLLFVGKTDLLLDEVVEYSEKYKKEVHLVEVPFSSHGFLKDMDEELSKEIFDEVNSFI